VKNTSNEQNCYSFGYYPDFVDCRDIILLRTSLEKRERYLLTLNDLMKRNNFSSIELMLNTFFVGAQLEISEPDSAKAHFHRALAYPDENLNMKTLKYRNIPRLGWLAYDAGDIDSALYYLQTAFEFYEKNGFLYWAMVNSRELGYIYYESKDVYNAEKYLQQSEKIFNEMLTKNSWYRHDSLEHITNYGLELYFPIPPLRLKEMMWNAGKSLYEILYFINDEKKITEKAHKYHIAYSNAKDTLNKLQKNRETIELQTRYESERKDQQIDTLSLENELKESRLQQKNYFLFGSIGLFILFLMFGFILYRQNKLKTSQQMLVLQQKLLRSQMNPHFIFNSLTSIQNYMLDEESFKVSKYLSRFSKLVRNILDSSIEENVPIEQEISTIENYIELQKIRFKSKFDYTLEVDEAIDQQNTTIPPMLAQPFIENSIEHGIKHKKTKGNIHIHFSLLKNMIVLEVEDDGVGREKAKEILNRQNLDHKSMATDITRERIRVMNKKLKRKIIFNILDLKDENGDPTGTKVVFEIPVLIN